MFCFSSQAGRFSTARWPLAFASAAQQYLTKEAQSRTLLARKWEKRGGVPSCFFFF